MPTSAPAEPAAHPWNACPFPGRFTVPTMLTPEEVNYLHWLGRDYHTGAGRVVDLGCFFGGSTVALATGMMANPDARPPLLTYDSFVMDSVAEKMFLHPYRDGESFRPIFDVMTTRVRDAVVVREGWLPESIDAAGERKLYTEQAPIEVLFVDVAKTWNVHLTVLRAFARHLIPGRSILVQQDFKHFYQFWIPIHMHQLRGCFRPVHDVPRSATMAFEYVGGLEEELPELLRPGAVTDAGGVHALWDEVESFWSSSPTALMTLKLNRAMHLNHARLFLDATSAMESFARWFGASAPPDAAHIGRSESAIAASIIEKHAGVYARQSHDAIRRRLNAIRLAPPEHRESVGFASSEWLRSCLWRRAAARCAEVGARRIALYGAGRHTEAMLRSGWPERADVRVLAVLDDSPALDHVHGVPVMKPGLAPKVDAVVVSSDAHEDTLYAAAARAMRDRGVPVFRIYAP